MRTPFKITASPTGFNAEEVTLEGYFEYNWDAKKERLLSKKIEIINLNPTKIVGGGVTRFLFAHKTFDKSQTKQYEGPWPSGLGYRDELNLVAAIFVTFLSPSGAMVTQQLASQEHKEFGNRYYEPLAKLSQFDPTANV